MTTTDRERLTQEAREIVDRLTAAKEKPAELETLQRQYGERLAHLKARLEEPA